MSVIAQLEEQRQKRREYVLDLIEEPETAQFIEAAPEEDVKAWFDDLYRGMAEKGPYRAVTLIEERPIVQRVMGSGEFTPEEKEQLLGTWLENVENAAEPTAGQRLRINASDAFFGVDSIGTVAGSLMDMYRAGANAAAGVSYEQGRIDSIEQELKARKEQPVTRDEAGRVIAWGTNHPEYRNFNDERLGKELSESKERFQRYDEQLKEKRFNAYQEFLKRDAEYAGMPQWEGAVEGILALAGQLGGAVPTPENLIPVPTGPVPVPGGVVKRMAVQGARQAAGNAALNIATEPIVQGEAISKGTQEEFSVKDAAIRTGLGSTIGMVAGAARGIRQAPVPEGAARTAVDEVPAGTPARTVEAPIEEMPQPKSGRPVTSAARQVAEESGEAPAPTTAAAIFDQALESGRPITAEDIAKLPKVERDFLGEFPELATEEGIAKLRERTRGVVDDTTAIETARRLGWTEQDVLRIQPGTALNAEQKLAMRGVVQSNTRLLRARQQKLKDADVPVDSPEYRMRSTEIARAVNDNMRLHQVERGVASEAGRALRAHQLQVDDYNSALAKASGYLADPKVRPEAKAALTRIIAGLDPDDPKQLVEAMRHIKDSTALEKFVEYATAVKLMGKQTFFVNILSSLTRQLIMPLERAVFAAVDAPNALRGGRNTYFAEALGEAVGQFKGYRDVPANIMRLLTDEEWAMKLRTTSDAMGSKPPAIRGRFGMDTWYDKFLDVTGSIVRLPYRGLAVGDILVRLPAENGAAYRLAYRDAIKRGHKPGSKAFSEAVAEFIAAPKPDSVREIMDDTANRALFQRDAKNKFIQNLGNLRSQHPSTKLIIPFFRTINDLFKTFIEYSPIAPVSKGVREDLAAGGAARSEALGRMVIGTASLFPLVDLAMQGKVTLGPPKDPHERDRWMRDNQPYSVKIGDKWVAYNRFAPFTFFLSTAAVLAESMKNEDEYETRSILADFIFGNARTIADQGYSKQVSDLLNAIEDPDRYAGKFLQEFITGSTTPNIFAEEARARDPVVRDTRNPENMMVQRMAAQVGAEEAPIVDWLAGLEAAYRQKIPEMSKTLPARTNVWGQEIRRSSPAETEIGRYWEQSLSPIRIFTPQKLIVDQELDAIGYKPTIPSKKVQGFDLSAGQYRVYKEASGRLSYALLDNLVQSEGWQQADPRQKEMWADTVMRESREVARNLIAMDAIVKSRLAKGMMAQGMTRDEAMTAAEQLAGERLSNFVESGLGRMQARIREFVEGGRTGAEGED